MGFVYDNNITIPNNKTDGNLPSIPTQWVAADANLVANALLDVRTAIQGGDYFALRDMSGGLPDVSTSGTVKLISNAGRAQVSSNGAAYRNLFPAFTTKTTSFTLGSESYVACDATAGAIAATLPAASSANAGFSYTVYKSDASANAVTCNSTTLATQLATASFLSTGTDWVLLTSAEQDSTVVDVQTRFGVVADGGTDDTSAIQDALDFGFDEVSAGRPCVLQFPIGTMKVSSTLLWRGNSAAAPTILGAAPVGFDRVASTFAWYGANNGVVLFAQSANKGVIQNITFDGRDTGGILMHLSASTYADPAILAATSGIRVLRCGFSSCKPGVSGNGCIALGTDPALTGGLTYQQSEVVFRDCWFIGESVGAAGFSWAGLAAYGIKTLSNGNCKNFAVYDCTFNVCETAINWTAGSGDFVLVNFNGGNCQKAVRQSDGHLIILGGDFECADVTDFCFLYGSGGGGDCCADIRSMEAFGYQAGAVGTMIEWGGSLSLTNCSFGNQNHSVSGNPSIPNPFKMIGSGVASAPAGITSTGCWFQGAVDYAPFYDGSGNWMAPVAGQYGGYTGTNVRSWGDKGGVNVNLTPVALGNFDSRPQTFFGTGHNGPFRLSYLTIATPTQFTVQNSAIAPIDATAGDQTLTLPTAVGAQGQVVFATKSDSSANTVTCNGVVLRSQYECALFVSNGASWDVLGVYLTTGAQRIGGQKTFSAPIIQSETGSITAHAGGGQGSATALSTAVNVVATVASSGDSVKLPTAIAGMEILVFNQGANPLDIFPVSGGSIDALGANTAYSLAATASRLFVGVSSTAWLSR